jgi:hypothetical protein
MIRSYRRAFAVGAFRADDQKLLIVLQQDPEGVAAVSPLSAILLATSPQSVS